MNPYASQAGRGYATQSGPAEDQPPGPSIGRHLDDIRESLDEAHKLVAVVVDRLAPVMRPAMPRIADTLKPPGLPPASCYGDHLTSIKAELGTLKSAIADIRDRIDL